MVTPENLCRHPQVPLIENHCCKLPRAETHHPSSTCPFGTPGPGNTSVTQLWALVQLSCPSISWVAGIVGWGPVLRPSDAVILTHRASRRLGRRETVK